MFCSSSFPSDSKKTVIVKLLVIHVLILLGIVGTPGLCVLVVINSVQHLVSDFFLLVLVLISLFFHSPWNVLWYTGIWGQISVLAFSFEELSFCLALAMNRQGQPSLAFGGFIGWVSG